MWPVNEILKPNKFKIILAALVLIPIFTIILAILDFYSGAEIINYRFYISLNHTLLPLIVGISLIISYLCGCFIDQYIPNKNVKLFIAIVSALITLIIIYIFYKMISEPVICDPVHKPSQGVDYDSKLLNNISVDKKTVHESFKKCLENIRK
ncbi:hypothetical protein [Methanobacterium alcaliphilum]|uniref:hypothetical protein n=1 Tax=Methanobacterium alcaliphilum TaxID=392018 RepID=UPI00200AB6D6|nr:hypothetical protein [Methanobacterium alcaliphilum]MCK9150881.1 hypothetical protein [Methanobacterium alcaliphilum]